MIVTIGGVHVEQGHGPLGFLGNPCGSGIFRGQHGTQGSHDGAPTIIEEVGGIQGRAGSAGLLNPMLSAVVRVEDRASPTDHPSGRRCREIHGIQGLLGVQRLWRPAFAAVGRPAESP